jgi:hypothetical protein
MGLVRISTVKPLGGFLVELKLTTGEIVRRDLEPLLQGPVFDQIRADEEQFRKVSVDGGTVVWPGGADLCPDMVIWRGLPPASDSSSRAA